MGEPAEHIVKGESTTTPSAEVICFTTKGRLTQDQIRERLDTGNDGLVITTERLVEEYLSKASFNVDSGKLTLSAPIKNIDHFIALCEFLFPGKGLEGSLPHISTYTPSNQEIPLKRENYMIVVGKNSFGIVDDDIIEALAQNGGLLNRANEGGIELGLKEPFLEKAKLLEFYSELTKLMSEGNNPHLKFITNDGQKISFYGEINDHRVLKTTNLSFDYETYLAFLRYKNENTYLDERLLADGGVNYRINGMEESDDLLTLSQTPKGNFILIVGDKFRSDFFYGLEGIGKLVAGLVQTGEVKLDQIRQGFITRDENSVNLIDAPLACIEKTTFLISPLVKDALVRYINTAFQSKDSLEAEKIVN